MLKMRAVITLLLLLLSMCGSQTRSTQTEVHTESQSIGAAAAAAAAEVSTQLDVSAELRGLSAIVLALRRVEPRLKFTQRARAWGLLLLLLLLKSPPSWTSLLSSGNSEPWCWS